MSLRTTLTCCSAAAVLAAPLLASTPAHAQEGRYRYQEDRALYPLEVEPHFAFGGENVYGDSGFGGGVRLDVPFAAGHLGHVPQNLAVSFGGDILHYDNCYWGDFCSANYLQVPVALQWNVFIAHRLSVFAEGGVFFYRGWFDECGPDDPGCSAPPDMGVLPTLALGGRFAVSRDAALTLRVGYPTTTFGISFM